MVKEVFKNFIVVAVLIGAFAFFYNTFFKSDEGEEILVEIDQSASGEAPKAAVEFLKTLADLEKVKLDSTVFEEETYRRLKDFSVLLVPEKKGRSNPFAPH